MLKSIKMNTVTVTVTVQKHCDCDKSCKFNPVIKKWCRFFCLHVRTVMKLLQSTEPVLVIFFFFTLILTISIPVWDDDRTRWPRGLRCEISGSIPAGGVNVFLLWVLCVVRYRSLLLADHSSRGVLPSVLCLSVIEKSLDKVKALTHYGLIRHKKYEMKLLSNSVVGFWK